MPADPAVTSQEPRSLPTIQTLGTLCYAFCRDCVWAALWRLPLAIAACTVLCFLLAAVPIGGSFLVRRAAPNGALIACLAVCHAIAGVLWGAHKTLRFSARAGLAILETHAPRLFDELLSPVTSMAGRTLPKVPVAQVRNCFPAKFCTVLQPAERISLLAPLAWLATTTAKWFLRAELTIIDRVLTDLEPSRRDRSLGRIP